MNLMSISEVLDRSIDTLRKNLKNIVLFNLAYGVISGIIAFFFIFIGIMATVSTSMVAPSNAGVIISTSIIILIIATFVISIKVGAIKISAQQYTGEKITVQNAITSSLINLPKIFAILFFAALAFSPAIYVFWKAISWAIDSLDLYLFGFGVKAAEWVYLLILPILTLLIAFFIVMLYFTLLCFSIQVAVIEKKGPIAAIARSFTLVKKNFWKLLGYNLIIILTVTGIRYSIQSILGLILGIIYLAGKLFSINQDYTILLTSLYGVLSWPINILTWLIISPIGAIMGTILYFNQRFKKEGLDIELKLRVLENTMEREQLSEFDKSDYNFKA